MHTSAERDEGIAGPITEKALGYELGRVIPVARYMLKRKRGNMDPDVVAHGCGEARERECSQ